MTPAPRSALELTDWRRRVAEMYAAVRAEVDPAAGHDVWRSRRDELFRSHPQTPLLPDDDLRVTGLSYWPYDPELRLQLELQPADREQRLSIPTGGDETTELTLLGGIQLPAPFDARLDVWWMAQYGGGLFLPLKDGTAGDTSYGGGRYLLDTAKGADLGGATDSELDGDLRTIVVDLNFLYHPSCRYNPDWVCPLAPPGNTIRGAVRGGEKL
jgi:uncharacterized protein (DUF1684 family)